MELFKLNYQRPSGRQDKFLTKLFLLVRESYGDISSDTFGALPFVEWETVGDMLDIKITIPTDIGKEQKSNDRE